MSDDDSATPFEAFLRQILGPEAAAEAMRTMRERGMDPATLGPMFSDPAEVARMTVQFQQLMNTSGDTVNWPFAVDIARTHVARLGDPAVTAQRASQYRQAMAVADLWLDTATDLAPGRVDRAVWTRTEWIDHTLEAWKRICDPVARNVSRALRDTLAERLPEADPVTGTDGEPPSGVEAMVSQMRSLMPRLPSMIFGVQIGTALSALAGEAFGATDSGLPLGGGATTALVPHNVDGFAEGLDVPPDEVLHFLAVRECAHHRLLHAVPWLSADLIAAVETYARHIAVDTDAIGEAAARIDLSDPDGLREALMGDVFAVTPTPEQARALEHLETLLALVEGWVEVVTARAVAPHLPHAEQLREMIRRRRSTGGPAEATLAQLIGLRMRPRRARGAATLFSLVESEEGREARDDLWSHPDLMPSAGDLDEPKSFLLLRRASTAREEEMDADLRALLDGTLGWAEGLAPEGAEGPEPGEEDASSNDGDTDGDTGGDGRGGGGGSDR